MIFDSVCVFSSIKQCVLQNSTVVLGRCEPVAPEESQSNIANLTAYILLLSIDNWDSVVPSFVSKYFCKQ